MMCEEPSAEPGKSGHQSGLSAPTAAETAPGAPAALGVIFNVEIDRSWCCSLTSGKH